MKDKLQKKLSAAQKDGAHDDVKVEDGSIKMTKGKSKNVVHISM